MSKDNRKWCYLLSEDAEEAFGPYDTREDAIASALRNVVEPGETIVLARCDFPDPGEQLCKGAMDRLMEELEEDCDYNMRNPEDYTFGVNEGATLDTLDTIIRTWLRENVHATYFQCARDTFETIESKP